MQTFDALVLSLPTRNSTLRMRLWRALKDAGSGVLRDGVYVVPAGKATLAQLESDIKSNGGFAMTVGLTPKTPQQLSDIQRLFDRSAQYENLLAKIAAAKNSLGRFGARRAQTGIRRLERSMEKLAQIDFFAGEAQTRAAAAMAALQAAYREMYAGGEPRFSQRDLRQADRTRYQKRVWATRKSPWVDRLASAWLIKRFIDREARFAWIARPSECPKKAVGYDFDGAEFTHVKNRVTFEVLAATFGLDKDPVVATIAAAVHFLDVGGAPVPEAKGLEAMLKGAREKAKSDDALLAEAMRVLDLLYSGLKGPQS
jgi:hypothetical protein